MRMYAAVKRHGEKDDDDDDEDDVEIHHHHHYHHGGHTDHMGVPHATTTASLGRHAIMADVQKHMENPPHSWKAYADQPGGALAIVEMEYRELMQAIATGNKADIELELFELAAASMMALKKMKLA